MNEIILKLYSIGAIKFGQFEIRKDFYSPFQVDLSLAISHPEISKQICKVIWEKARPFKFDLLCGEPNFGICLAGFISWEYEFPMVMRRFDRSEGVKILGKYKSGQKGLIIGDCLLSGLKTLDLAGDMESEGIEVKDILTFIDLELGGKQKLKARGYSPHFVINMSEIIEILYNAEKLGGDQYKLSTDFLENV